jgi:hypothetical protein
MEQMAELYYQQPDRWADGVRPFAESAFPRQEIFCARLDKLLLPGHCLINGASGQGKSTLILNFAVLALTLGWAVWIFTLKPTNLYFNFARSMPAALCRRRQFLSILRPGAAGMCSYAAVADIMRDANGDKKKFGNILGKSLVAVVGYERQYGLRTWVGGPTGDLPHYCGNATSGPYGIDMADVLRQIDHTRHGNTDLERAIQGFIDNDILHPERCPGMDLLDIDAGLRPQSLTVIEGNHADDPVQSLDLFNLLIDSVIRKQKARGLAGRAQPVLCLYDECAPGVIDNPLLPSWATCREPARVHFVFASQGLESQTKPRKGISGGSVLRDICDTQIEFTPSADKIRDMLARAGEEWQMMTSTSVTDHGLSRCVSESSRFDLVPTVNPSLLYWAAATSGWTLTQLPEVPLLVCRPLYPTTAEDFANFVSTPLPERPRPPEMPPPEPEPKARANNAPPVIDPDAIAAAGAQKRKHRRAKRRNRR